MKMKALAVTAWISFLVSAAWEWGLDIDLPLTPALWLMIAAFALTATSARAVLTTNSWIPTFSDPWDFDPAFWTAGLPDSTDAANLITNAMDKTVTINGGTAPGTLTISNLTVQGFGSHTNALRLINTLTNATPRTFVVFNSLTVGTNALLIVTNSNIRVEGVSGGAFTIDGGVSLERGSIVATNSGSFVTIIGFTKQGSLIIKAGTSRFEEVDVGSFANSQGTLTIAGGTNEFSSITVGLFTNSIGNVWVTGGRLVATNGAIRIANSGVSQMTVSNGTVLAGDLTVGEQNGSQGTLTILGGTNTFSSLIVGDFTNGIGNVWMKGGRFAVSNGDVSIGFFSTGQMTVSNGTVLARTVRVARFDGSQGTLSVVGGTVAMAGPLTIGAGAPGGGGKVIVTGGQLVITNRPDLVGAGSGFVIDGSVTMTNSSSSIVATNGGTLIGNRGGGSLTINGGSAIFGITLVGAGAGGVGTFTVSAGLVDLLDPSQSMTIGSAAGSTGTLWLTGGLLQATNAPGDFAVGRDGVGRMTVSNGMFSVLNEVVGVGSNGGGTLTLVGGTNTVASNLSIGAGTSTGTVSITGGRLVVTKGTTRIGSTSFGEMFVTKGTVFSSNVIVGVSDGSEGLLEFEGGTNHIYSSLTIGSYNCAASGIVSVVFGALLVTNATTTAVVDVRSGSLILHNGTIKIDRLVITNACGHFSHFGSGTIILNTPAVLPAGLDADGDGLPNDWEQKFGLDPLADFGDNGANGDPDGDGLSNLQEFLAGSNPVVDIKAIAKEGNNVRVTWQAAAGKTNALQSSAGSNGSYSNNFADIFIVTNNVGSVTNYLDIGAATNKPARYYRVRLVP